MSFEEIFDLLLSNDTNQREVGSIALFDAIDKNLIKHFEGKWRLTYQEADDLSQMSMFKIVQKAHTVTEAKKFERWCWIVAKNQARDYLRKIKREKEVIDFNSEKFIDESQIQNDHDEVTDTDDCVKVGYKKFAKTYPERSYALDLQQEGCSIKENSIYIDRTPAATKEFLSQCRKKLIPFIKHCLDIK